MADYNSISQLFLGIDATATDFFSLVINSGWAVIIGIVLCFYALFAMSKLEKTGVFESELPKNSIFYGPLFWIVSTSQLGFSTFVYIFMGSYDSLSVASGFIILGIYSAGRILVKLGSPNYAKALFYGLMSWSIVVYAIALYSNPLAFGNIIPKAILIPFIAAFFYEKIDCLAVRTINAKDGKTKFGKFCIRINKYLRL